MRICACAVLCCIVGAVLGQVSGGFSTAVRLGGLALALGGMLGILGETVSRIAELGLGDRAVEYVSLMLRGLGIAVLCRICSDVCRDCGAPVVALAVESAGKLATVLLAMPVVADIIGIASELIEGL